MDEVFGVVRRKCPECGEWIPENTRRCPNCTYERSFDQDQYLRLVACAYEPEEVTARWCQKLLPKAGHDPQNDVIVNWNHWRAKTKEPIRLEGAKLKEATLDGANLLDANLDGARLSSATFDRTTNLRNASLHGANLCGATLDRANLDEATLDQAELSFATLNGAKLAKARLRGTEMSYTELRKVRLAGADLRGATVRQAEVDGKTHIEDIVSIYPPDIPVKVDTQTDFRGVGLEAATVQPDRLGQLQYCCRRLEWEDWYRNTNWLLEWSTWLFWQVSDYGRSTKRILGWLAILSVVFAAAYGVGEVLSDGGLVSGLTTTVEGNMEVLWYVVPFRAFYFSVVTMTTLGVGDLVAHHESIPGHFLLAFQTFLGYILLGALITRFAIMFQGGGGPVPKPELGPNATRLEPAEEWFWNHVTKPRLLWFRVLKGWVRPRRWCRRWLDPWTYWREIQNHRP